MAGPFSLSNQAVPQVRHLSPSLRAQSWGRGSPAAQPSSAQPAPALKAGFCAQFLGPYKSRAGNSKHPGEAAYQGHCLGRAHFCCPPALARFRDTAGDNRGEVQGCKGSRTLKMLEVLQKDIGNGLAAFCLSQSEDRVLRGCHIV